MEEDRLDAAALMALAAEHGYDVSARSLELWRYRGLVPRPQRQGRARAIWLHPPGTERQLLHLLYWRQQTRSHDLIRICLWVEGFPVELEAVRASLVAFVDTWSDALARELGRTDEVSATIDLLARKLAGMRGKSVVPRVARMSAGERRRAYAYALAVMFGADDEVERRKNDVALLERMLGLRSGRGGGLATMIPLDDDTRRLARLPAPEEVHAVIADARPEEFEFVRRIIQMTVVWFPLLLPVLLDDQGAKATPFIELARQFFADVPAGFHAFLLTALIVSLHAKEPAIDELRRHLAALAPGVLDLELLAELPPDTRRAAFEKLPPERQQRVASELARQRGSRRAPASVFRARD